MWPRLACKLPGWAGEGRPGAEKGEHLWQPDHRGSGGLWLSVKDKAMTRREALTEAGAGGAGIARTGQFH